MIINKNRKTIYAEDLLSLAEDIVVAEALGTAFDKETEGGKSFSKLNKAAGNDKFYELSKLVNKLTDDYVNYVDIYGFLESVKRDNFPHQDLDDRSEMPINEDRTLFKRKFEAYSRLVDMVDYYAFKKGLFTVNFDSPNADDEKMLKLFENSNLSVLWRDTALLTYAMEANSTMVSKVVGVSPVMKEYENNMRKKLFDDLKRFDNGTPEFFLSLHFDLADAKTTINDDMKYDFYTRYNRYLPAFDNEECQDTSKRYFNLCLDNLKKSILAYGIAKNRIVLENEDAYDELVSKFGDKDATNFNNVTIVGKKHPDVKALADVSRGKEVRDTDIEMEF